MVDSVVNLEEDSVVNSVVNSAEESVVDSVIDASEAMRVSALASEYKTGKFGILKSDGTAGVVLSDIANLSLWQIAAWQTSIKSVEAALIKATAIPSAPAPCTAQLGNQASVLRIEPMKWWVIATTPANLPPKLASLAPLQLKPQHGATLDLSHSRTHIRISGANAADFLNRFLPLDFREQSFPENAVASSAIHHIGVTLWRSTQGFELFIPRGFALSLWQMFIEVAAQFGGEVR